FGRQSPNVTQRQSTPPASPAAPSQAQQRNATQPNAAPNPAAQPQRRGFGGMIAGLAAGLGLAWLAHSLGLGPMFANILLFALLAVVAMAVIGMVMRRRQPAGMERSGYAWQGAGGSADAPVSPRS